MGKMLHGVTVRGLAEAIIVRQTAAREVLRVTFISMRCEGFEDELGRFHIRYRIL